jgi:hypothetical protein
MVTIRVEEVGISTSAMDAVSLTNGKRFFTDLTTTSTIGDNIICVRVV